MLLAAVGFDCCGAAAKLIEARGITLGDTGAAVLAGVFMIVRVPHLSTLCASTLQSKA